ncbi:phosphatidate phosphatase PAH2 isoform X4 [Magnolia sinica]|uniref:phosphatidate phosphatase PAH2 isoform X4 n=1 Tax=Magnolia sinica TaxID=86752 RepID=UPI002658595B|nr:phosphatidate phosphatase PAH2 isoform X4 [Magnolia sinica]
MNAVERLSSYISRGVYTVSGPFHPFGGAVDIIVVQQQDGSFKSSPWYVRFGKFQGMLKTREKVVNVSVNGTDAGFHMYLNHKGEAYFLREVDSNEGGSVFSSPSLGDETDNRLQNGRLTNTQGMDFDGNQSSSVMQIDVSNGKIMSRTNSQRPRIFGLMFGRKLMKDEDRLKKGDANMQRVNSLERAEIAADLLEVKWSTNLQTSNRRTGTAACLSAPETAAEEKHKDLQVGDKQEPCSPSVHDSNDHSVANVENSYGITSPKHPCLQTHEQILQSSEVHDVENACSNEVLASELSVFHLQGPSFDESEVGLVDDSSDFSDSNTEKASDRNDGILTAHVSEKENGGRGASAYIHSETSINLSAGINASGEGGLETLSFSNGGGEEVEVYTEVLHSTTELISEVNSKPESDLLIVKESLHGFDDSSLRLSNGENSLESHTLKVEYDDKTASEKSLEKSISFEASSTDGGPMQLESLSSLDIQLLSSGSVESEMVELIHQDTVVEKLAPEMTLETEPSEILENQFQMHELTFSSSVVDSHQESNNDSLPERLVNSSMPPSNSFEEDQFLFGNPDDFAVSEIRYEELISEDSVKMGVQETEGIGEQHEPNSINHVSPLPPNRFFGPRSFSTAGLYSGGLDEDLSMNTFEASPEESRGRTSPISIPKSRRCTGEVAHLAGSLPNIQAHPYELERSNVLRPLSRSMDSSSESSNWGMLRKDFSSSLKLKPATESRIIQDHPTADATVVDTLSIAHERMSSNPAVEISLCRHLLFEGMGADAASQAFDTEKVDLKKFSDLGPSVMENDNLVVKIGGRYFPWDVAAPIVLGMVSFGPGLTFPPEGMIAVDQVEKTLEGDLSRAVAPSGGSWRLWPFSFRKSKSEISVCPARDGPKGKGAEADNNASENSREATGENKANKAWTPKKKAVRVIVPTSEQLASLNLKEGRNVITFTFSTAMLGRQQVDARIYLWKWNARIVVSDVDGTITKSDVLGQFMPLVGRDWSQSGVTHLFSAIKENGYQLLFLSARAISQAYLTRRFLFTLKQDGKALPDGPVLISPDGLFPSLYREVIRRAPHEFKIACLEDIRALFPLDCNPFYAGFGNRDTDEFSYRKVGMPKGKIFIINPKGEVAVNRRVDTKSYSSLHSLVNGMFPAMSSAEQEDYNSWNYWKMPLPEINV